MIFNGLKPKRVSDFIISCFQNYNKSEKEKQKGKISGKLFSVSNFLDFWKVRNTFWYQL